MRPCGDRRQPHRPLAQYRRQRHSAVRRNVVSDKSGSVKFIGIEGIGTRLHLYRQRGGRRPADRPFGFRQIRPRTSPTGATTPSRIASSGPRSFKAKPPASPATTFTGARWATRSAAIPQPGIPRTAATGSAPTGPAGLVFEDCVFQNNGGYGAATWRQARRRPHVPALQDHRQRTGRRHRPLAVHGDGVQRLQGRGQQGRPAPGGQTLSQPAARCRLPSARADPAGKAAQFQCDSPAAGGIVARLWDFGDGIPEVTDQPQHTFVQPGKYRVTLVVWDKSGRGGRVEKMIQVLPGK